MEVSCNVLTFGMCQIHPGTFQYKFHEFIPRDFYLVNLGGVKEDIERSEHCSAPAYEPGIFGALGMSLFVS